MDNYELQRQQDEFIREFNKDSQIIGDQTVAFLRHIYPSYLVDQANIEPYIDSNGVFRLQSMTFFRIASCTADNVEKVFENINERFEKLFTALYSINIPMAYGLISNNNITNLVIGVYQNSDVESVKAITQGMLSGIELTPFTPNFADNSGINRSHGILSGVPSLFVKEQKQNFSLASIMRSLNGQNYTLLFVAKPVGREIITQNITDLISVRDTAFAVSKRNIARSSSFSESTTNANSGSDSKNSIAGQVGSGAGAGAGAVALRKKEVTTTYLLIPITIELSASDFLILKENLSVLTDMGFIIEEFGVNTFIVKGHPTWILEDYEEESIRRIIDLVISIKDKFDPIKFNDNMAKTLACKMSIKANMRISNIAQQELLNELVLCDNPYNCPHGRPTIIHFSIYDLERMFKRVMN